MAAESPTIVLVHGAWADATGRIGRPQQSAGIIR
jgi:hypothetical protein